MPKTSTETLRVLEPAENILAFYDGRIPNQRLHSQASNWLDDGAYALGIANYVVFDGSEGLVYDTNISIDHGNAIRRELERRGITSIRVILSHYHNDHIAGNEAFADCEILASRKTAEKMLEMVEELASEDPPIAPVVMPTEVFDGTKTMSVGTIDVELRPLDIHSFDGLVLYLPQRGILLAGDTLEDTVTYVDEPTRLPTHLAELDRLSTWPVKSILPSHGDPDLIAKGGYGVSMIQAAHSYTSKLLRCCDSHELAECSLKEFVAEQIADGSVIYHEAYEQVHRQNVSAVLTAKSLDGKWDEK